MLCPVPHPQDLLRETLAWPLCLGIRIFSPPFFTALERLEPPLHMALLRP